MREPSDDTYRRRSTIRGRTTSGHGRTLDYSAAYDRVSIQLLLAKMGKLYCPAHLLLWLRSFLSDRRARCRWETSKTRERVIPNGLPQGSSLAPLLWNVFIYDLLDAVSHSRCSLFAHDTAISYTGKEYTDCSRKLQKDLKQISRYCYNHEININPQKTNRPAPHGK